MEHFQVSWDVCRVWVSIILNASDESNKNHNLISCLCDFSTLGSLALYNASIEGTLPTEIGFLKSLGELLSLKWSILFTACRIGVSKSLIFCLPLNQKHVGVLLIGQTQITGPIPSEIGQLTQLGEYSYSSLRWERYCNCLQDAFSHHRSIVLVTECSEWHNPFSDWSLNFSHSAQSGAAKLDWYYSNGAITID
jgi:hypothetical protein